MQKVRCKECNQEFNVTTKFFCCGCPNMMTVNEDKVSANDLSKVVWSKSKNIIKNDGILTKDDLKYQEERRKRKVRKLNFEIR